MRTHKFGFPYLLTSLVAFPSFPIDNRTMEEKEALSIQYFSDILMRN
jgi:hypothetical protein